MWRGSSLSHFGAKWICSDCKKSLTRSCSIKGSQTLNKPIKAPWCLKVMLPLAWWMCSGEVLLTCQWPKPGLLTIVLSESSCPSKDIAFLRKTCCWLPPAPISSSSVYTAKPHGSHNEAFLGRKTLGCSARSPEGCCAPCICFNWAEL